MRNHRFERHRSQAATLLMLVAWFCSGGFYAAAQSVKTIVSKKQVMVGEPFVLAFWVKDVSVQEVAFPALTGNSADIIRQWAKDSVDAQGNAWAVQMHQLMLLQPGEFRVPSQLVRIRKNNISQNLKTPMATVVVQLLPVAQPDLTAEPLATIAYARHEWLPYATGLVCLFLAGLGLVAYRKRKMWVPKRSPNARKQALQQLKAVTDNGISPMDKKYALQMSRILKDYLTERFGIAAHHLTVNEIAQELTMQGVDAVKVSHCENLLQQLQFLIYHPATDTKSKPVSLVGELRQTIDLLEKFW
jgi:hypothetical protein